jgi:hypothetical protein
MMKTWGSIVVATLVGVTAHATFAQTAAFQCPPPGAFVRFSDDRVVTSVAPGANYCTMRFKSNSGEQDLKWYAPTLASPVNQQQFADQVKPWNLWPLSVGKKLSANYTGVGSGYGQGRWTQNVSVDAYEKVTTKAGTYDAFVINRVEDAISHQYKRTQRVWYAPAVGFIVKGTDTDTQGVNRAYEAVEVRPGR